MAEQSRLPGPVDKHVANKINERRKAQNVPLRALGDCLGVSYQQAKKFTTGHSRIASGQLYEIGRLLGVKPGWFFEGLP